MSSQFPVPDAFKKNAWIDEAKYREMYKRSIENPEAFWGEQAKRLDWIKPWSRVKNTSYTGDVQIRWFEGGQLKIGRAHV